jgi:hypothetical protein
MKNLECRRSTLCRLLPHENEVIVILVIIADIEQWDAPFIAKDRPWCH